jgi:hypothetical protein
MHGQVQVPVRNELKSCRRAAMSRSFGELH